MRKLLKALRAFARPNSKLGHIAAERAVCIKAYQDAQKARDTRRLNAATARLQDITTLELRATAYGWRGGR